MEKRYLAFGAICIVIFILWGVFFGPKATKPKQEKPAPTEQTESSSEGEQPTDGGSAPAGTGEREAQPDTTAGGTRTSETLGPTNGAGETAPEGESPEGGETPEPVVFEEQTFELSSSFATFLISNKGGVVRQVTMETKVTSPDHGIVIHGDERYEFCDAELPQRMLPLAMTAAEGSALNLAEAEFKNVTPEGAEQRLVLRHETEAFSVTKEFALLADRDYQLLVKLSFRAKADKVDLPEYQLQVGAVTPVDQRRPRGETVITVNTGSFRKLKVASEKKTPIEESVQVLRWAAVSNKYFTAVLDARGLKREAEIGAQKLISEALFLRYADARKKQKLFGDGLSVVLPRQTLTKDREQSIDLTLYIGPKEYARLRPLGYSKIMGTTFLAQLSGALMAVLNFIYGFIPNYGIAIIILTALVKGLLFPLDRRSFKSMKEMQKIQPLLKQLQEKYKDDKQQLQVEQMKLFREHKVNPLGGCFPLLLQFPVLWAMFTMLRNAVELWRAPFVSYVNDLSQPDTLFRISGFEVHILPILMVVFTVLSQRIRGASQTVDPQQKMMSQMMPILFLFIFYTFPSGLNLYWLFSTVFSFGVQVLVQRGDDKLKLQEARVTHERTGKR